MSGSFEPERWNACAHRLDLGLYSYLKESLKIVKNLDLKDLSMFGMGRRPIVIFWEG